MNLKRIWVLNKSSRSRSNLQLGVSHDRIYKMNHTRPLRMTNRPLVCVYPMQSCAHAGRARSDFELRNYSVHRSHAEGLPGKNDSDIRGSRRSGGRLYSRSFSAGGTEIVVFLNETWQINGRSMTTQSSTDPAMKSCWFTTSTAAEAQAPYWCSEFAHGQHER